MGGQPITDNPVLIMAINMTIVFGVLIALWGVINMIHYFDPTRKKEVKQEVPATPAPITAQPAAVVAAVTQPEDTKADDKTVKAVITTAIMASGAAKEFEITSIRKV